VFLLSSEKSSELYLRAINDDSPRVSRTAEVLIKRGNLAMSQEQIETALGVAKNEGAIKRLLRLASCLGKWGRLSLILQHYEKDVPAYQRLLEDWLATFNFRQELPTSEQTIFIRELLVRNAVIIKEEALFSLRFTLKPFGIVGQHDS